MFTYTWNPEQAVFSWIFGDGNNHLFCIDLKSWNCKEPFQNMVGFRVLGILGMYHQNQAMFGTFRSKMNRLFSGPRNQKAILQVLQRRQKLRQFNSCCWLQCLDEFTLVGWLDLMQNYPGVFPRDFLISRKKAWTTQHFMVHMVYVLICFDHCSNGWVRRAPLRKNVGVWGVT